MRAAITFAPAHFNIIDLHISGKIGSPLAPLTISRALSQLPTKGGLFWNPGFMPPFFDQVPSVVTVHDLTHLHFYNRARKVYYNLVLKPLYRRCEAVICVSDYTRREFLDWSGMPAKKVHLVYNGVAIDFPDIEPFLAEYKYIFYPGNHRSYKNLARLIEAFAISSLPRRNIHLLLTGPVNEVLLILARKLGVASFIQFLGPLSAEELARTYKGAFGVVFVSLYEGFGLPILEGMAAGVPVLTSSVSALPEIAGGAALTVDPYSVADITKGLESLTTEGALRADLIGRGLSRAKQFSWQRSGEELWSIIDNVAMNPRT
jgi:glycosyltransferase involved in cell wall biosynthesis